MDKLTAQAQKAQKAHNNVLLKAAFLLFDLFTVWLCCV